MAGCVERGSPHSKVLILDANDAITSMGPLFTQGWTEIYGPMVK